jgi:ketosteroid isomerase-like protein
MGLLLQRVRGIRMRRFFWLRSVLVVGLLCGAFAVGAQAQAAATDPLFQTIQKLDTELFAAYNNCDLAKLGSMVSDDLEFYHDQTGLAVGKQVFLEAIQKNICGKVRRDLVAGSLEVYPLKGFGAVEIGVHRFHHPGHDDTEGVGEAKFVQIWQNKDGVWRVTRVISFDHHSMTK